MPGGNWLSFRVSTTAAALVVWVLGAALLTVSPMAASAAPAAPPDARHRPARPVEVQLEIAIPDVDAGVPFQVRVRSKHVGKAKVFLERRPAGTRDWVKAAKLGKRGLFNAPGVGVGTYTYRLVVKRHGKVLARSKTRQLRAYGALTLQQYCSSQGATVSACADGSVLVGGSAYLHHASANNTGTDATVAPSAQFANSSCRRITLTFAVSDVSAGAGVTGAAVSLTQDKGGSPQTMTAAAGSIGTATFAVGSKGWNLRFWTAPTAAVVYWDATLNCFTTDGIRKPGK